MQQAEAFPYDGIARACEPSRLLFRQAGNIAPQRMNEQDFREFGKHGFAADASRRCFLHQVQDGTLKPVPGAKSQVMYPHTNREVASPPPVRNGLKSRDLILAEIP
jgi:hypothetical protein